MAIGNISSGAHMPGHIGIVASTAEGAALCYRTICSEGAQFFGPHAHPEITMHGHSWAAYVRCLEHDDWRGVGELMLDSANRLARSGADFLIAPSNTMHHALPLIEARSPLPWLNIAEVVATQARERGYKYLGLTGTRWLVESSIYPARLEALGLRWLRPTASELDELNRVILEELIYGTFKPGAVQFCRELIERMKGQGCDAVVLGCTEIPLIIGDENSALPTLDSTRLLARAALRRAAEQ